MKQLYDVELTTRMAVMAGSENDAYRVAESNAMLEEATAVSATPVTSLSDLPTDFHDSLPWGDDRTIREILGTPTTPENGAERT